MNMVDSVSPRANRMLGALPMAHYMGLSPHLEPVQLQAGHVLEGAGVPSTHAHFPIDCAVTLVSATRDGEMSELALIGREGMVGLQAMLGAPTTALQSVVLRPGLAYRVPVSILSQTLQQSSAMQTMTLRYLQNLMLQMAQGVVCSLHHSVLQRLSTWLLYHHTVTQSPQVKATHETIAHMLGVRRESITQAAGQLQQFGCISTSRGRITLHEPDGLRQHVCECYAMVEHDHQQLWQTQLQELSAWGGNGHADSGSAALDEPLDLPAVNGHGRDEGRYADIYDFAPVGLLSIDSQGRLVEVNMAAAIQLDISRSQCHQYRFADFVQDEARASFEDFHREVLSGRCRRHCDIALKAAAHRGPAVVRLEATVDESGEESRMVMVDVSDTYERLQQLQSRGPAPERSAWWPAPQTSTSAPTRAMAG